MLKRKCSRCGEYKTVDKFVYNKKVKAYGCCKDCTRKYHTEYMRKWRKERKFNEKH